MKKYVNINEKNINNDKITVSDIFASFIIALVSCIIGTSILIFIAYLCMIFSK